MVETQNERRRYTHRKDGEPKYVTVTGRLRAARGSAKAQRCTECAGRAYSWAFVPTGEHELLWDDMRGTPYTTSLEDWQPRCSKHHARRERAIVLAQARRAERELVIASIVGRCEAAGAAS